MLTRIHLLTAACVASGTLFFAAPGLADEVLIQKDNTVIKHDSIMVKNDIVLLPAGITAKELNSENAIEKSFKGLTEYALDKTGFDNLVGYLADQDTARIKKSTDKPLTNLDGNNNKALTDVIANLEGAWKAKYNGKFSIESKKSYTSDFLHIMTGEVTDPALLIGNWPVGEPGMQTGGKVSEADADQAKNKMFGGKVNLEKGRNVAIARIVTGHGMPAITASLIHETASGWHFDISNNTNAQGLYDNLVSNLTFLNTHRDSLPGEVDDANRMVTHAVVAALYNIDLQKLPVDRTKQDR